MVVSARRLSAAIAAVGLLGGLGVMPAPAQQQGQAVENARTAASTATPQQGQQQRSQAGGILSDPPFFRGRGQHRIGPGRVTIDTHRAHIFSSWSGRKLRAMPAKNGVGRPPKGKA